MGSCVPRAHILWIRGYISEVFTLMMGMKQSTQEAGRERSRNVWKQVPVLGRTLWFSSFSLCLSYIFPLLLENLFQPQVGGTWWERNIQNHKGIKTQLFSNIFSVSVIPTLSPNHPREAWFQWYRIWAQGSQELDIGFLDFPLDTNVALTSSGFPVGIPKEGISYDQRVF